MPLNHNVSTVNFSQSLTTAQNKDQFINNELSFLQGYYNQETLLHSTIDGIQHAAPYKILYRYEPNTPAFDNWGEVYLNGQFERTPELEEFRDKSINEFMRLRKINGNQAAPRVNQVIGTDTPGLGPQIMMACGNATYQDQVGTNMVIDWQEFAKHNSYGFQTLRDYNQHFSRTPEGKLPALQNSALANTLGVSVGFIAPIDDTPNSPYVTLVRMRTNNVAINGGTWAPALSFAAKTPGSSGYFDGTLKDFLSVDLNEEAMQEVGINADEFTIKPLALAQDLGRGGKPELFLVAESKISMTELNRRQALPEAQMQKREATGDFLRQENTSDIIAPYAPQSLAIGILVHQQYNKK